MVKKISRLILFLIVSSVFAPLTFSMSKSQTMETVEQIKKNYDKTNEDLKKYEVRLVKIEPAHGTSYYSIGDSAEYYTENGKLKKITVFQFYILGENDTEKWINEYYVKNGKLYFAIEMNIEKNGKKVKNPRMTEYYFSSDERLARMIEDGKTYDGIDGFFAEFEFGIIEKFYEIKNLK